MSEENIHRLEGSGEVRGGLVIRKKKAEDDFKTPQSSLLGLDKLAALKEKEKERLSSDDKQNESAAKKLKSCDDGEARKQSDEHRKYRSRYDETPTHTGGVSKDVYERRKERDRKDRERGLVVTSKSDKKERDKEGDRDRDRDRYYSSRDRDRHRDREVNDRSERYDRNDRSERYDRDRSERRNRSQVAIYKNFFHCRLSGVYTTAKIELN
jgi:hypothetical protein